MKRLLNSFLLIFAATFPLLLSCDKENMSEKEKEDAASVFTKVALAGEYGVMNITGTNDQGETDLPLFGDHLSFTDQQGRPVTIMVLDVEGTWYAAMNRVWKDVLVSGTWDVVSDELHLKGNTAADPDEKYRIKDFKDGLLYLENGNLTLVLKRLTDADKCPQLKSVEFLANIANDGKLYIDPSVELNAAGTYKLNWKYDPQDYEPYKELSFTSSDPEVATVDSEGYVRPAQGLGAGETTTIRLWCDYVEAEIQLYFYEIN